MTANAPALVTGRSDSLLQQSGNAAELTDGQQANAKSGCKFQDVRLAQNSYRYQCDGLFTVKLDSDGDGRLNKQPPQPSYARSIPRKTNTPHASSSHSAS